MNAKLMPTEILLARLEVYQYRAWSRCWEELLAGIEDDDRKSVAFKWFGDLTSTPEEVVRKTRTNQSKENVPS